MLKYVMVLIGLVILLCLILVRDKLIFDTGVDSIPKITVVGEKQIEKLTQVEIARAETEEIARAEAELEEITRDVKNKTKEIVKR